jgi:stage III sporulation protein SpoIIIAA
LTSSRHMILIGLVMAASSSSSEVLVIDALIGTMPSTVAISTSPPSAMCAFMPIGGETW